LNKIIFFHFTHILFSLAPFPLSFFENRQHHTK